MSIEKGQISLPKSRLMSQLLAVRTSMEKLVAKRLLNLLDKNITKTDV